MRVVPADPVLQSMQTLLPATGVPDFITDVIHKTMGRKVEPENGEIAYVRYRPSEQCTVVWRFPVASGPPLLISGSTFSDDRCARIIEGPEYRALVERARLSLKGQSQPYTYFADRQLLFQVFPLDIRLPALPLAMSDTWLRNAFSGCLDVAPEDIRLVEATPVSYKPSIRCVFRYTLRLNDRYVQYFGKVFKDERGASMLSSLRALRAQLQSGDAPWDTPAPLSYFVDGRMLVIEPLENAVELKTLIKQAANDSDAMRNLREYMVMAAVGLSTFQRVDVDGLASVTPQVRLSRVSAKMEQLHSVNPSLSHAIRAVLAKLESAASRLPSEAVVPTHMAFRYTQCLLYNGKLGVVDLDNFCLSGASADAGEFLARFDMARLREPSLRSVIKECEEAFLVSLYENVSVDPQWLAWYRAFGAVKWALYSFFSLSPGWPETTAGLIAGVERLLVTLSASGRNKASC